jgi:hypothetical protein
MLPLCAFRSLLYIRVDLRWVSRWFRQPSVAQLLVVTGALCPLTKPVVLLLSNDRRPLGPIATEGCRPAVFTSTWRSASRPRGPGGPALAVPAAALVLYFH